jgi:ABC-2 type transport system permease protein
VAIGLFVSARTDNPIVALIGTALLCGVFYLIGSPVVSGLFGNRGGELLQLLGSGARFESIARGVIDLRDLYFYVSVTGVFLALNVYSLERLRWAEKATGATAGAHRCLGTLVGLLVANLLAANLWLHQVGGPRLDLTQGRAYTISLATRNYLGQIEEPLLIRGYFSAQTHPLLAPLVPQLRDLLREYEVAGGGQVRVEIIDPQDHPDLEREAGERFGIRPVAFETASKYQAGVVNSYFDVLVQYGDRFERLGFRDLIEVKGGGEGDLSVRLRNPEYDLTRTIKKVLYGYRAGGDLFAGLTKPVALHAYISDPAALPPPLPGLVDDLKAVLGALAAGSKGRFTSDIRDPEAKDGALGRELTERFGFQPLVLGLLDPRPFWFYLVLESGDQAIPVPLPEETSRAGIRRAVEAGIRRLAPGYLKTLAIYTPPGGAGFPGMEGASGGFQALQETLGESVSLRPTDLAKGRVPAEADLLLVVQPEAFTERQVFAIDQFLMQGGTIILAASPYHLDLGGTALSARPQPTGLEEWLKHLGIDLTPTLVLDPQNTPFPIPVPRNLGGFTVEEIQMLDYPYFPDLRGEGLGQSPGIAAGLGQLTLTWASPVAVDADKNQERTVTDLLRSSPGAWTNASSEIQPDFSQGPLGFAIGKDLGPKTLGVAVEGRFDSLFAGRPSPLLTQDEAVKAEADPEDPEPEPEPKPKPDPGVVPGVMDSSPASARVILIGSASFLTDAALGLATQATQTVYTKPLELIQNAVEWSLEDRGLLALRGRGQYSRLLMPLGPNERLFWEGLNYALALAGLALVYLLHRRARARRRAFYDAVLTAGRS